MGIKIAEIKITSDERLYENCKLIKDIESMGYIVIESDGLKEKYVITR